MSQNQDAEIRDAVADAEIRNAIASLYELASLTWEDIWELVVVIGDQPPGLSKILFGVPGKDELTIELKLDELRRDEVAHDLGLPANKGHESAVGCELMRRLLVKKYELPSAMTVAEICKIFALRKLVKKLQLPKNTSWEALVKMVTHNILVKILKLPNDAGQTVIRAYLQQRHPASTSDQDLVRAELSKHPNFNITANTSWEEIQMYLVSNEMTGCPANDPLESFYLWLMEDIIDGTEGYLPD